MEKRAWALQYHSLHGSIIMGERLTVVSLPLWGGRLESRCEIFQRQDSHHCETLLHIHKKTAADDTCGCKWLDYFKPERICPSRQNVVSFPCGVAEKRNAPFLPIGVRSCAKRKNSEKVKVRSWRN